MFQRVGPALKEQQKALQTLQNQNVIKEEEIVKSREQKCLIEQHVGILTTKLAAAQILNGELKEQKQVIEQQVGILTTGLSVAQILNGELREQKQVIEQHVGILTSELSAAQRAIEELECQTKRNLMLMGLGVGAVLVWLYVKRKRAVDSTVPDSLHCVICMEGTKEVMMDPCGHVCCCRRCASMLSNNGEIRCPVCRGRADVRPVFIS
eukprot:GFUD01022172.1.p1 GENE.GFUD01022172.1~~GFUD01022172.1.p1  ORF type:complete len:232 (-),score=48.15 GFUD01022172.1:142-768(-)